MSPGAIDDVGEVVGRVGEGVVRRVTSVPEAFAAVVAERFAHRRGARFALVLSGGPTARQCYEALASLKPGRIEWSLVDVYLGDERYVPADDPDANQRLVREALVDPVGGVGTFVPMPTELPLEAAAEAYAATVDRASATGGLDLVHLGLGPDGHTASLFPGSDELAVADDLVVPSVDPNGQNPHPRISFTLPAIARAGLALFTVEGRSKTEALRRVLQGEDLPAARVRAAEVVWLADDEALGTTP